MFTLQRQSPYVAEDKMYMVLSQNLYVANTQSICRKDKIHSYFLRTHYSCFCIVDKQSSS